MIQRPALTVIDGGGDTALAWRWFCGHCAAPAPGGATPAPTARVCRSCGFGLLLEAREDAVPAANDAFVVVDSALMVQAMSREAQTLLGIGEELAINRPISELLVPADSESQSATGFAAKIVQAAEGDGGTARSFVRPWNTFGVRLRARIATCGPPRAALVVLENGRSPSARPLRAVH